MGTAQKEHRVCRGTTAWGSPWTASWSGLTEDLLCAGFYSRCWREGCEQDRQGPHGLGEGGGRTAEQRIITTDGGRSRGVMGQRWGVKRPRSLLMIRMEGWGHER